MRCDERGKTWEGGDPKCAFPDGKFDVANWNCATMAALRAKVEDDAFWHDDHSTAMIMIPDDPRILVLNWYKSRGRTGFAFPVCDYEREDLTLERAEDYIRDGIVLKISTK
jgi:hypothetical protein